MKSSWRGPGKTLYVVGWMMCDICKDGEMCIDGLLDGSASVVGDDDGLGVPPVAESAEGLIGSAKEFMKLTGYVGPEAPGYQMLVYRVADRFSELLIKHVDSDMRENVLAAIQVIISFDERDGSAYVSCAGCGDVLRIVERSKS